MELMCGQGQQNDKASAVLGLPRQVPNFAGTVLDVVSKASMNAEALNYYHKDFIDICPETEQ